MKAKSVSENIRKIFYPKTTKEIDSKVYGWSELKKFYEKLKEKVNENEIELLLLADNDGAFIAFYPKKNRR